MSKIVTLFIAAFAVMSFAVADLKPVDTKDAVTFTIKNFGINTNGSLTGLKGVIKWDDKNIAANSFNVSVDVSTINTGIDSRDEHLRGEEYFNATKYPTITLASTSITNTNNGYVAVANLTIKGTIKTVTMPFTVTNAANGYNFQSEFTIDRRDFNIGGGSMVLGDDVKVKLNVTATY